jgi:tRNA1Val (adenine37-N6)-methyltransferase
MRNSYFQFKQFKIDQSDCAMKVTTDASLFGAWLAAQSRQTEHALDIGGGTGLLSLMLAQKNETKIDVIEIEQRCFDQMKKNIEHTEWTSRIQCILQDVRNYSAKVRYSIIFSNPPFHQGQLRSVDSAINLARHGDELTLELLFRKVYELLSENGVFYLLGPAYRDDETISIASHVEMYLKTRVIVKQSVHHEPFRIMYAFSKIKHSAYVMDEIIIKDSKDQYTEKFVDYLRDYYLYM